jgi:hypothetical protein
MTHASKKTCRPALTGNPNRLVGSRFGGKITGPVPAAVPSLDISQVGQLLGGGVVGLSTQNNRPAAATRRGAGKVPAGSADTSVVPDSVPSDLQSEVVGYLVRIHAAPFNS